MDTAIAALVVGFIVLIAIAAVWMKRHRVNKDKTPVFNCRVTSEGKKSGKPNSPDIYDCVEEDDAIKPEKQT